MPGIVTTIETADCIYFYTFSRSNKYHEQDGYWWNKWGQIIFNIKLNKYRFHVGRSISVETVMITLLERKMTPGTIRYAELNDNFQYFYLYKSEHDSDDVELWIQIYIDFRNNRYEFNLGSIGRYEITLIDLSHTCQR